MNNFTIVRHCDPMRRSGAKYFKEASPERTLSEPSHCVATSHSVANINKKKNIDKTKKRLVNQYYRRIVVNTFLCYIK